MFDANQSLAEDLLRKGEIDLAITELSGRTGLSIQSCNLLRVPLVLVVPKKTPWKSSDAIFQRRHSISLLALPPDEAIMKNFQAGLKKLKLGWSPAVELSSLELVETYVALGFGVGVSLGMRPRKIRRDLRVLPLRKFPPLTIAALWLGQLSPLADLLLADLKKLAQRMARGRAEVAS